MRKILITGTSGFLGGSLATYLRQNGFYVCGISRKNSRPNSVDQNISHDLVNPLPKNLGQFDTIFHAAALTSPFASPQDFYKNIEQATFNIVEFAKNNARRFVNISSTSVHYIMADQFDIEETTPFPTQPINLYAGAKLKAEKIVLSNLPNALSVRPRAIYGPHDTVLMPRLLRAAKKGLLPKIIRPDLKSPVSDMIYIGNLVRILKQAIYLDISGVVNVTDNDPVETQMVLQQIFSQLNFQNAKFNLSLKTAMNLAKIAEFLSRNFFNYKEPPITQFGVSALVHCKTFNVTKMLKIFGAPKYSSAEGIANFIAWQKNKNLKINL
ncbi:MAG: NAD(P)-dependent oxidoreductase [Rickettsiales bacterium]|nr:NAD(P)-dependent oxidoreductase [Rickettsiales bacterium]